MSARFAKRMDSVHRSFIREILKVTAEPDVISFAGGLPNPALFPVKEMSRAAAKVIENDGQTALQYSTTEGYAPLRQFIAARYAEKKGIKVEPDEILITTGSQQCLDLIGKVFIDPGDKVLIERPGYLGAIQAFSVFEPKFETIPLEEDGPDIPDMEKVLADDDVKLYYAVPNFQNPSGLSYSEEKREMTARVLAGKSTIFIEDDPYGELRFLGQDKKPMVRGFLPEKHILLGSFSKIAAPGFRLGWIVSDNATREKLVTAKQASDLHTSTVSQRIMHQYLMDNDIDAHIERIRRSYGRQREVMTEMIGRYFPDSVDCTKPEGGMFLWITLPEGCSSMLLFEKAIEHKVAFVPGKPFYVDGSGDNTLRLNFSNSSEAIIEEGIKRLGRCIREFLAPKTKSPRPVAASPQTARESHV